MPYGAQDRDPWCPVPRPYKWRPSRDCQQNPKSWSLPEVQLSRVSRFHKSAPAFPCVTSERQDLLPAGVVQAGRSEEHTSELQSLMRISYAVFCLKKKNKKNLSNSYN